MTLVGALALTPAAYSAVQTTPQATTAAPTDDALESRIENLLKKDSILAARSIDVEADHGRVTLTGAVRTEDERARASRLAKVDGVSTVINNLEVDPNADRSKTTRAAEKTKEGLNKAVDATVKGAEKAKEGVGKAAEKTGEAIGTAGDKMSEAGISTRVKTGLAKDAILKDISIDVETKGRVVTLRGTVPSAAAKTKAEEIAARTEGVTRVVNELVVRP